jgi:hypothetical protein
MARGKLKRILVACEYSGRVRNALIMQGYDAVSCDLLPTESAGPHYQGDVFDIIDDGWDGMVAHPECTFLCNSGVKHLYLGGKKVNGIDPVRWRKMKAAAKFFRRLKDANIPVIVVENPIPHGYALELIGDYSQITHPWQHGHLEQKATALWIKTKAGTWIKRNSGGGSRADERRVRRDDEAAICAARQSALRGPRSEPLEEPLSYLLWYRCRACNSDRMVILWRA